MRVLLVPLFLAASAHAQPNDWTHFAGSPSRVSLTPEAVSITSPRWSINHDDQGRQITFLGQAGAVTLGPRVFARGFSGSQSRLFAFDRTIGQAIWNQPVPGPVLESWASPGADADNDTVLVADGFSLTCLDAASGAAEWTAGFARPLVSVSPLVTTDLHPRDRAFVVDYDGFGGGGHLHCINVDPFDAGQNPWQPGEEVWAVPIGGTSGNTPAYAAGVVYVASIADETGFTPGRVLAFPAGAAMPPNPLWVTPNPQPLGFFGGVSVAGGAVYAASYNFSGGLFSANLVKLDAASGAVRWSTPANRTATCPVPFGDGRIALSAGLRGFGTVPSVQLFRDDGASATRLWDSALDSWIDANQNQVMEPGEYLVVGGWTQQPVAAASGLLASVLPPGASTTGAPQEMYLLNLDRDPGEPQFVAAHFAGAGSSPAVAGGWVYTIGPDALYAFAPPCKPDCNADGTLNLADFGCFQTKFALGDPYADCNGDGTLNLADFGCFQTAFAAGCP